MAAGEAQEEAVVEAWKIGKAVVVEARVGPRSGAWRRGEIL